MRIAAATALTAVALGRCTAIPSFQPGTEDDTPAIIQHIQCLLHDAYSTLQQQPRYSYLFNWAAAYKLTYKADATLAATLGPAVWTIPVTHSLTGSVAQTNENVRQGVVEYKNNFPYVPCQPSVDERGSQIAFEGDLGIQQWLTKSLAASAWNDLSGKQEVPDILSYQVSFAATFDANVKPGLTLVKLTLGAMADAKQVNTNTLDLAFTVIPPSPKVTHVIVDNFPGQSKAPEAVLPKAPKKQVPPPIDPYTSQKLDQQFMMLDNQLLQLQPR